MRRSVLIALFGFPLILFGNDHAITGKIVDANDGTTIIDAHILNVESEPLVGILSNIEGVLSWIKRFFYEIIMICLVSLLMAILFSYVFNFHADQGRVNMIIISKYFTFSFIACLTFVLLI